MLLTTIVLGLTFPASFHAPAAGRGSHRVGAPGTFLAVEHAGVDRGSFLVPFLLIPLVGSPHAAALLALVNVTTGAVDRPDSVDCARERSAGRRPIVAAVVAARDRGRVRRARRPRLAERGPPSAPGRDDLRRRARTRSRPSRPAEVRTTPELWVAGTSMTLLTVDAKMMPILPLIARPESKDALVVAFGMGTVVPVGADRRAPAPTSSSSCRPCPKMFRLLLPGRGRRCWRTLTAT